MGLPHMPSSYVAEEMAASRISSNSMHLDMLTAERNKVTELSMESQFVNMHNDGNSNLHELKLKSVEQIGRLSVNAGGHDMHLPASRTVGFQIKALSSPTNNDGHGYTSTIFNVNIDTSEDIDSVARKRLLSPLNEMLLADHYKGDPLVIDSGTCRSSPNIGDDSYKAPFMQDCKRVHFADSNYLHCPIWSQPCFLGATNPFSIESIENHVLPNHDLSPHKDEKPCSYSKIDSIEETGRIRFRPAALSIPRKQAWMPPSFPLSPLGPKSAERTKARGEHGGVSMMVDDDNVNLKDMELSPDTPLTDFLSVQNGDSFSAPCNLLQEPNNLHHTFNMFTFDDTCGIEERSHGASFPPRHAKFRAFSGLTNRRSLVGSFEECLLSGRLLSGKVSQVDIIFIYNVFSLHFFIVKLALFK